MADLNMKLLIAIMGMTGSDSDGEALNALRKAQAMLKASGKSWSDVLRAPPLGMPLDANEGYRTPPSRRRGAGDTSRYGKRASQARPAENTERVTSAVIETMLQECAERRHDVSSLMFLASLRAFYDDNEYLTVPQFDALKRLHGNTGRGRGGFKF